jgi:hypothetical protein
LRYAVTLRGPRGASEVVHVEADSGDDAAEKAFKPHHIINEVTPVQDYVPPPEGPVIERRKKAKAN